MLQSRCVCGCMCVCACACTCAQPALLLLVGAHVTNLRENSCGLFRMTMFPTKAKRIISWRKETISTEIYLKASKWKKAKFPIFLHHLYFSYTLNSSCTAAQAHNLHGNIVATLHTFSNRGAGLTGGTWSHCVDEQVKNTGDDVWWLTVDPFLLLITNNNCSVWSVRVETERFSLSDMGLTWKSLWTTRWNCHYGLMLGNKKWEILQCV